MVVPMFSQFAYVDTKSPDIAGIRRSFFLLVSIIRNRALLPYSLWEYYSKRDFSNLVTKKAVKLFLKFIAFSFNKKKTFWNFLLQFLSNFNEMK